MPRNEEEPLVRIHLHMFERDFEDLKSLYGSNMGHTKAVRLIIRRFLNGLREKANTHNGPISKELDIEV